MCFGGILIRLCGVRLALTIILKCHISCRVMMCLSEFYFNSNCIVFEKYFLCRNKGMGSFPCTDYKHSKHS